MVDQKAEAAVQVQDSWTSVSDLDSLLGFQLHRADVLHLSLFREILAPLGSGLID